MVMLYQENDGAHVLFLMDYHHLCPCYRVNSCGGKLQCVYNGVIRPENKRF